MGEYTYERNAQIIIQLLKESNIRKVIASPGTTNACLVASMQGDPFFDIYSAPEERSAAYMACGMSAESGEPIVLTCTGATASRNYMPALTEAFYRKLPILAITSSRRNAYIGHNMHQVTDRTALPNDIAKLSVQMPIVHDDVSEWQCIIAANKAILELKHHGGGPVHINLETTYSKITVNEIKPVRKIDRFTYGDKLPDLCGNKIAIFVGNHQPIDDGLSIAIDKFCSTYNAVVLCDHTSNYKGKYRIFASLLCNQVHWKSSLYGLDVLIHIGEVSTVDVDLEPKQVWRISPDGELKDTFGKLKYVFELNEIDFFNEYRNDSINNDSYYQTCKSELDELYSKIPDLPFSSLWMAYISRKQIPEGSALHLGIRNSLKTWNFFDIPDSVTEFSNTGGFGIDGSISTLVGAALVNPNKLFFCVLGDLAFFYDISVFGNRHFPKNIRILLVNNAVGFEMHGSFTLGNIIASNFGVNKDKYIAAGGHYGQGCNNVVKHFVEDFGCDYMSASNKTEYISQLELFFDSKITNKSIVFETHVNPEDEDVANTIISGLVEERNKGAKTAVKQLIGDSNYDILKKGIKKFIK